jgi:glutaredoxin-related protein
VLQSEFIIDQIKILCHWPTIPRNNVSGMGFFLGGGLHINIKHEKLKSLESTSIQPFCYGEPKSFQK